ncbi:2-succinyl-5-enolpyruvyl-6-hydroxy-3-cyclohexene-1-carboxylic-acid synthase [Ruania halotolerans]|uniref:2-succinyl-5-enolpyruvyl-6-hydroxy-3- cyclohexene-1-carboxylic-acid synthase n=1 Tax=Ruania halotolerans TaxID=2897773 RepID=UPI001E2B574B|nr:2-succinyl-5-enolpyruvyl-6-hydroxy-3-cyclohexene-1-carboxylic-acid synthase [Ruania halotolerans]UFU05811.1 2-succinyl-5-enolpyruvyl-6-hydroxy-3-cyclohexene-1-carboxylic-acid synthase [Ruania halotolerans]
MTNPSTARARAVVTALVAAGVRDVVLAPGSRSAPLAYALHAAESAGWLQVHIRIDERSAGFVALGIARVRPAAVVTTSGTAVANLHPAVLEAAHSGAPLVVVSADRPHELRGVGANQTTDQVKIFGSTVRSFTELPADDADPARGVRSAVTRAVLAAIGARTRTPGPVHLNVAFRDPLTPDDGPWVEEIPSPVQVIGSQPGEPVALPRGPRTVVVAGDGAPSAASVEQAASWGWPILAEPSSGLRGAATAVVAGRVIVEELADQIERVVVLGRPTLSRPVTRLLARDDVDVVVVPGTADWADVAGTARVIADAVAVPGELDDGEQDWLHRWLAASVAVAAELAQPRPLDGPAVAHAVLAAGGTVVLGSSMAVRDADLAAPAGPAPSGATRVFANRGLAGIDGTISTATGLALTGTPVRALMGDLTFAHDVGGLARGRLEREVDLQVVVLNDDGGSIFATLEHGKNEYAHTFGRFFATPQGVDIAALAAGFGAVYRRVSTAAELAETLTMPVRGRSVVEVRLDPDTARQRAETMTARLREVVRS